MSKYLLLAFLTSCSALVDLMPRLPVVDLIEDVVEEIIEKDDVAIVFSEIC